MTRPTLSLFFFQAEDGIRDHCVTGVQTCALPIYLGVPRDERRVAGVVGDELEREALGVAEGQRAVAAPAADAPLPEVERLLARDPEHDPVDLPVPRAAPCRAGILEEGDVGPGRTGLVRVEQVVDGRIVLVDGLLDEPQSERAGVELDVLRRVAGDARDVMDAMELHAVILPARWTLP